MFNLLYGRGGAVIPFPVPSAPSSSSSWTEDSFDIGVLLEPFPETETESQGSHSVNSSMPRAAPDEAEPSHQHEASPDEQRRMRATQQLSNLLERQLRKYCKTPEVIAKYPQVQEADISYLASRMALSLAGDVTTAAEIEGLVTCSLLTNYSKAKSSLRSFLDSYYCDL